MSSFEGSNTDLPGQPKLGMKKPGGGGCCGPIQKMLKKCCSCCPCFSFKAVILLFSWLWVAISFVSVSIFIRSVDEDVAYSRVMLNSQKFENETIDIIVQNPIRPFKVRKVVLLFDFGLMCLLDFIADLLLTIGIYKGRPELVTQWISTTIIWLTLLSVGPIIKLNPDSVEETKIISIGIMILAIRIFWGFSVVSMYSFEQKGKESAIDDDLNPAMGRVKKLMGGAMDEFIG